MIILLSRISFLFIFMSCKHKMKILFRTYFVTGIRNCHSPNFIDGGGGWLGWC